MSWSSIPLICLLSWSCFSYKQRKFNLFREESEGYAKLLVELNQEQTNSSPEHMLEVIKAIIGMASFLSCQFFLYRPGHKVVTGSVLNVLYRSAKSLHFVRETRLL